MTIVISYDDLGNIAGYWDTEKECWVPKDVFDEQSEESEEEEEE